jgi:serine protease Do
VQIASILSKGKLEVPYLGVRYIVLNKAVKEQYKLDSEEGAWLMAMGAQNAVANGSPADKAGLKQGDIITKVNDDTLSSTNVLSSALSKYNVGETIYLTYIRDGKTQTAKAVLEVAPSTN